MAVQFSLAAPGESVIVAIGGVVVEALRYAAVVRSTMSERNRNDLDALNNRLFRRFVDLVDPVQVPGEAKNPLGLLGPPEAPGIIK